MEKSPWPFFFEVNLIQRKAFRERTVFVTVEAGGVSHWVDHSGCFTRRGGFGGIEVGPGGEIMHTRGDRTITPEQEEAEKREFTVKVEIPDSDFRPIRTLVDRVGKPWIEGWSGDDSEMMHGLLENIYWKHVNRFMHEPFDPTDALTLPTVPGKRPLSVQLGCPTVQPARPIGQAAWNAVRRTCPIARLKWPTGRVDGEIVRVVRAVGHLAWPVARLVRTLGHAKWPLPECPPMAERRFPRPDADFAAYMNNYYEAVSKFYEDQGLDQELLTPLTKALETWNAAFPAHVRAQAAAEAARQNKDAARAALEKEVRPVTNFVQAWGGTTNADRASIGITIKDTGGTPVPPPASKPLIVVNDGGRLTHTLRLVDESTPTRRARPRGAERAEVFVAFTPTGTPAPADLNAFRYVQSVSDGATVLSFEQPQGGMTAHYVARWVTRRGAIGPWSDTSSATVAA